MKVAHVIQPGVVAGAERVVLSGCASLHAAGAEVTLVVLEEARAEQADIDYWNQTGRGTNEAGLRAYLQRYPQGQFAGLARQRLEDINAQQDRDYWSQKIGRAHV